MKLINKLLFFIIIIIVFSQIVLSLEEREKIYFLNLRYDQGKINLVNLVLIEGFPNLLKDKLPYKLELYSYTGKVIDYGYFDIPNIIFPPPPLNSEDKSRIIILDKVNFSVSLSYNEQAKEIKIKKEQIVLLVIDVSQYSIYCGNSICQVGEDGNNCPKDCPKKEVNIPYTKPKSVKEFNWFYIMIPLIILIVIGIIGLILYLKKPKE